MNSLNVVVPVKDPRGAKQRLASMLPQETRTILARALLEQTLGDIARYVPEAGRLLVSDDEEMAAVAEAYGAGFLHEPAAAGETRAVERATDWSLEAGFASQLVIPADMAQIEGDDLLALVNAPRESPSVILCPAVDDDGTNAILSTPPDAIGYRFGDRSFASYCARAEAAGVPFHVMRLESLVLDIDTPADVRAFIARHPVNPIASWLTRQLSGPAS